MFTTLRNCSRLFLLNISLVGGACDGVAFIVEGVLASSLGQILGVASL